MLHDAEAAGELEARQAAGEAPERLAVAGADDEHVLLAPPLRLGGEPESLAALELDRLEGVEGHGRGLGRLAVDPDRPLGPARRVVDPRDEIPGDRTPILGDADPCRPAPHGVARVVARGLVDHPQGLELPPPRADSKVAG